MLFSLQQLGMAKLAKLRARLLLLLFLSHFVLQLQCSNGLQREPKQVYVIYLGERQHEDVDLVTASHHDLLASIVGSKEEALESIIYSYRHGFSGFSALLTKSQSIRIAALPGVVSVTKNRFYQIHTTRSWDFVGLDYNQPNGLLTTAKNGEDIIVGVIDTGIWPESLSFAEDGYGPPPPKWKGICQSGAWFGPNNCNRKLIGARWYAANDIDKSLLDGEFLSPRDAHGHGTHTASTAAGNLVHNVSFHGIAPGVARGGAPRARIAVYKVCWGAYPSPGSCSIAGIMKAIDDAIHDGVDVLSLSIGGPLELPGTLHAVANGITVVFSAGNGGPIAQTVENMSPWLLTVAATTVDRLLPTAITLGNNQRIVGQSLYVATKGADHFYEVLPYIGTECDPDYINSTDVKGKIYFCITPSNLFLPRQYTAIIKLLLEKGGKGFIHSKYNDDLIYRLESVSRLIPVIAVDLETAYQIWEYCMNVNYSVQINTLNGYIFILMHYWLEACSACTLYDKRRCCRQGGSLRVVSSDDTPKAKISLTETTIGSGVPAPKVAAFSSRGPSPIYPGVLKPDIAAPGVTILAAAAQIAHYKDLGVLYRFASGTSMSCPHVSGIVALLKSVHPDWSPAALKSALMTTALTSDNNGFSIQADGNPVKIADPFDYGAGFVNPSKAADPGLIYDIHPTDYLRFFHCVRGLDVNGSCTTDPKASVADLNLPSIAIPNLKASESVVRTVTNVGQHDAVYKALFEPPPGVEMFVEPSVLEFSKERRVQSFKVVFKATRRIQGDYTFGSLAWHDEGSHWVRIPIAVRIIIEDFYSTVS